MPDHLHALPAGYKLNEYRLERVLGSGGFGITYYAWDENLNKPVAIKEYLPSDFAVRADGTSVRPKSDGDAGDYQWGLERFLDEARALARFDHPHLNQVRRFFEAHDTAYLVLDYIDGETLGQMLGREGKLSEAPLLRLLNELLSGLEEVHQAGYVHRDVKPGNIMFRADGGAVLLDFGAARQAIGAKSKSVTSILTPGYAPIEQYDQKADDVGAWSDLYALGMVAYRCVSGIGESGLIDAVTRSRLERKGELEKDLPAAVLAGKGCYAEALLAAIDWAIKMDETERPQSVAALRSAIGGGQSGGAGGQSGQAESRPPRKPLEREVKPAVSATPQLELEASKAKPDYTARFVLAAVVIAAAVAGGLWWQQPQKDAAEAELTDAAQKCTRHFNDDQYTQALPWCRKAAEQGNAWAQNNLGLMYQNGQGVTRDYAEAAKWHRKAAEQGNAWGQTYLGLMYQNGQGVIQNDAETAKWHRKAAEQGNAWAQNNLGDMYKRGQGVTQNDAEAVKWYRKSAEQGNALAQNNLGVMYERGDGIAQDFAEAAKWYRKAAEQGNAWAQNNLGVKYERGNGVTRDYAEAVKWYRKAAEQGNVQAQYNLGRMYQNGEGVTKDDAEAVKWYRKSANQGNAWAQNNLGVMYYGGNGVTRDYAEAVKWHRKAAEQGNASAQNNLGRMYYDGEGVTRDYAQAFKWYRKAAEQGDARAQTNLGAMYRYGKGVTRDDAEAVKWFRKAAEQGDANAQYHLGLMYHKGQGVSNLPDEMPPPPPQENLTLPAHGHISAEEQARNFEKFMSTLTKSDSTQNDAEAVKWFRKAAEQGHVWAQNNLGLMYQNGQGVTRNLAEARKWYERAAAQGDVSAKKSLENL